MLKSLGGNDLWLRTALRNDGKFVEKRALFTIIDHPSAAVILMQQINVVNNLLDILDDS
jgi:hypothetical protein